jgi:hypothetical protein
VSKLALKADLSMSERQEAVLVALRKRTAVSDLYVAELYDARAVYSIYGTGESSGKSFEVEYTIDDDGVVTLGEDVVEVQRRTIYQAVKFADEDDDGSMIRGLAIPFGGPIKGKDIDGEDFGPDTDLCLDWFPDGRPILYHHGINGAIKTSVIGRQVALETDDEGVWVKAELDKASRWYSRVKKLIDQGALGFSSGAMPHLVKATKSGHITRWPWVELTLTPTRANPNAALAYAVKGSVDDITDTGDGQEHGPYTEHGERVLADVHGFLERTDDRAESRLKVGRELSAANREALTKLDGHLAGWERDVATKRKRIQDLLARTESAPAAKSEDSTALEAELLISELRRAGRID